MPPNAPSGYAPGSAKSALVQIRINMVRLPPRDGAAPFAAAAQEMVGQVQNLGPNPLRVCSEEADPNAPSPEDALLAELGLL